ncbi:hypothetical protein C6N75_08460 [Streptomyces solincola]|uniref:Uncharacterized protein n=1 Tax=Streptomyces solincola TaxID=2100817 RepID=A0A2S9PZ07_9ACTN|nr:hypothetical protein [Streptomyces solincola]PRH79655.1 hypothetical protein C6N75_08460 [Streptomyces solincola]
MTTTLTPALTLPAPLRGGWLKDMEREDDARGPERDETDTQQLHQLVAGLVAEGDQRAAATGRRVRRSLQEMAPGHARQPVLTLSRPAFAPSLPRPARPEQGAEDACPICSYWRCRCVRSHVRAAGSDPAPVPYAAAQSGSGQCSVCRMRFPDWNGGVCDACRATGRG